MKNYNEVEVVLFCDYPLTDFRHKELVKWLATIIQPAILRQHEKAKKLFLRILKDTPAIFLS